MTGMLAVDMAMRMPRILVLALYSSSDKVRQSNHRSSNGKDLEDPLHWVMADRHWSASLRTGTLCDE